MQRMLALGSVLLLSILSVACTSESGDSTTETIDGEGALPPARTTAPTPTETNGESGVRGGIAVATNAEIAREARPFLRPSPSLEATPPVDAIPCGGGTFTAEQVVAACTAESDGLGCDATLTRGGRYETWCRAATKTEPARTWVWVVFDQARMTEELALACSPDVPLGELGFAMEGAFVAIDEAGVRTSGATQAIGGGAEWKRAHLDRKAGNEVAVFAEFAGEHRRIDLGVTIPCTRKAAGAIMPLKVQLQF